jgi:hypothetical protein
MSEEYLGFKDGPNQQSPISRGNTFILNLNIDEIFNQKVFNTVDKNEYLCVCWVLNC